MKFLSILVMLLATFATVHADDTLGSKQDFMEDPGKINYFTDPATFIEPDYFADVATIIEPDYFADVATIIEPDYFADVATILDRREYPLSPDQRNYPLFPDQRDYPLSNQDRSAIIHFFHSYLDNEDQKSRLERICEVNSQLASSIPQLSQRCQEEAMENLDQLPEEEKLRIIHANIRAHLTTTYNKAVLNRACDTNPQLVEQIPQLVQYCNRRVELMDQLSEEEKLRIIHDNIRAHLTTTYNKAVLNRACDTNPQLVEQIPQLVQYCNRRVELMDQLSNPSHTGELIPTLPVVAHDELIPSLPVTYDNKLTEL